ncbi:MAG: hypothetical protein QOD55_778, partial [Solirubrobacteraceae bacterium]|nr:hypothetical protein [Solirubrobacteraceae bacterium]
MSPSTKKTAVLLGAAVALSSGAYALGSQAGDGGAVASSPPAASAASATVTAAGPQRGRDRGPRGGHGLDTLAGRLGVSPEALRAALQDLRGPKAEGRGRQDVAAALAAAL